MNVELHENGPLAIKASLHHIKSDPNDTAHRYVHLTIIDVRGSVNIYSIAGGTQHFATMLYSAAIRLQVAIDAAEENQH